MHFQAYFKHTITDEGFRNVAVNGRTTGYEIRIRFPSYRGSQLSCVTRLDLTVDGAPVDPKDMLLCLNGKEFLMSQIPELYSEYWFVLDRATLRVAKEGGLAPGNHGIRVDFAYRVPYTGYSGDYVIAEGKHVRTLAMVR